MHIIMRLNEDRYLVAVGLSGRRVMLASDGAGGMAGTK